MSKKYFRPYDYDLDFEFKTYQCIGRDYGNSKTANQGWICNLKRFLERREIKNRQNINFAINSLNGKSM